MTPFLANVVWPALFLEVRLFSWWAIGFGLVIEFFFVKWLTGMSLRRCLLADIGMNAASALLGILLIPLAGIAWEIFPGLLVYSLFDIGTFNPATWVATFAMAVFINAILESLVLRHAFNQIDVKQNFWWLSVVNSLTVGLAFASLFVMPPKV